jgi:competence protein ComEC
MFWSAGLIGVGIFVFLFSFVFSGKILTPSVRVIACDVGQGDATLVKYDQLVILIDVGPNSAIKQCLQANISPTRPIIDLLVLTHDDSDHIGGFSDGLHGYRVNHLFINPKIKDTKSAQAVKHWMSETGRFSHPQTGDLFAFPGIRLKIVWSEDELVSQFTSGALEEGSNNASIGLFMEAQSFGFLSLGDLGCAQELAVGRGALLKKTHLLKMSHHGSKTSSCLEFLEIIRPEAAYYSAARGNSYGHPSPLSLESIAKVGAFLRGTDQAGEFFFAWKDKQLFFASKNELESLRVKNKTQSISEP